MSRDRGNGVVNKVLERHTDIAAVQKLLRTAWVCVIDRTDCLRRFWYRRYRRESAGRCRGEWNEAPTPTSSRSAPVLGGIQTKFEEETPSGSCLSHNPSVRATSCILYVLKSKWRGKRVWRGSSSCCLLLGWVGYLGAASCCVVGRIEHPASYFRTE